MPDTVIVGAGIVGASVALAFARADRSVVVVDKGGAVGGASTSASSAVIRFNYSTADGVLASWESKHGWDAWADHLGGIDGPAARFIRTGLLFFEPPGFDRAPYRRHFTDLGIPFEELDEETLAARFPMFDTGRFHPPRLPDDDRFFDDAAGRLNAWYSPSPGFIDDPQLAAVNVMDAARRHGAEVRLRSEVVEVRRGDGRVTGVGLADGTVLDADVVVNAAGPWSARLNTLAGVATDMTIGTRALRQEVHVVPTPEGFDLDEVGLMLADLDLGFYCRPQPGGMLLVGGVEADCDPLEWVDDPDTMTPTATVDCWQAHTWRLARRLPGARVPTSPAGLASLYDVTPDWVPIYDRSSLPGFFMAVGTSGNQFKNAPIIGRIMLALVEADEAGRDHDADPVQVPLPHTGRSLDLGAFSRNRPPTATTGTVLG